MLSLTFFQKYLYTCFTLALHCFTLFKKITLLVFISKKVLYLYLYCSGRFGT